MAIYLVYSGAMDIVLAFVPWKLIWTLTMNKKEKFGVLVAMSMGILYGPPLSCIHVSKSESPLLATAHLLTSHEKIKQCRHNIDHQNHTTSFHIQLRLHRIHDAVGDSRMCRGSNHHHGSIDPHLASPP